MLDGHNLPKVISVDLLNAQLGQEFLLAQECTSRGTRYHVLKVTLISPNGFLFFTNEPMPSPSLGFHPTTGKSVGRAKWTVIRRATAADIDRKGKNRAANGITPHERTVYQQAATKRAFMLLSALQWYVENDDVDEHDPDNAYWITGKRWAQTIIKAVNEGAPESLIAEKKRLFSEELVEKLKAEMLNKRGEGSGSKDLIVRGTVEVPVHAEATTDFVERGAFV